jgi:hypothetical protein
MRLTLKTVNDELAKRGQRAVLAKGAGYFYFSSGETDDWLDRTVKVPAINSLTLEEWVKEFGRLKELNARILRPAAKVKRKRS